LRPARKKKPLTPTQRQQRWRAKAKAARGVKPSTGNDEWYTPAEYVERARRVLGEIDLDPASNQHAQQIINAKQYFTKADDALAQVWRERVWLNPPYSNGLLARFVEKMVLEVEAENVTAGIMLLPNFTDAGWFQAAFSICAAVCFLCGRIHFENASGKADRPLNGQVFFYYGRNVDLFRSEFSALGAILDCRRGADIATGETVKIEAADKPYEESRVDFMRALATAGRHRVLIPGC
jgi:phage N-6-adenine-methyltransferase